MRRQQLEARVLAVVEVVAGGGRVEDDRVECKAAWPDPSKVARQLAGHANAARGETVLWVVGLDEDAHAVTGAADADLADWWPQVERRFADGVAPELTSLVVPVGDGRAVLALEFRTDRSPYLVTTSGQGGVDREAPWRSGTRIRSAKRQELLRVLVEAAAAPDLEVVTARLTASHPVAEERDAHGNNLPHPGQVVLRLEGRVFLEAGAPAMLPAHRWRCAAVLESAKVPDVPLAVSFALPLGYAPAGPYRDPSHPRGVDVREGGMYLSGPGALDMSAMGAVDPGLSSYVQFAPHARLELTLPVSGSDRSASASATLRLEATPPTALMAKWRLVP